MGNEIQEVIIKNFFEARIKNQENFYSHPSYELEQRLLNCIVREDVDDAKFVLGQINALERAKLSDNSLRSLKNSLICSCTLFTRAILGEGVNPEIAYDLSDVYIRQIEKTDREQSLIRLEYEMLYSFIATLRDEKQPSYQYIVNRTIALIDQQILQELSLERIAEQIKVNPSYLSKIFRKEVGVTLTEYINRKKILSSKYFLEHSDLPLSRITAIFSFCNQSYYTALFKRFTGITPKQYRSRLSAKRKA